MQYQVAVIGLGNIGLGFDLGSTDDARVATHCRAFTRHNGYELVAAVDPLAENRRCFEKEYRRPAYTDLASLLGAGHRPDVFSIAVPTPLHAGVFDEVLSLAPKAILCEKPLAESVAEAEKMVADAKTRGCILAVNFMRRFEPGVLELLGHIRSGDIGEIYKGSAWYSKGLLNNGSHLVDLLGFLLGAPGEATLLHPGRKWQGEDPEPDFYMRFGTAGVSVLAAREECFSLLGFELVGTQGVINYSGGGHVIRIFGTCDAPGLPGYRILENNGTTLRTDLKRSQWHAVDALHQRLDMGVNLNSSGESALATLRAVDRVRAMLHQGA